MILSQQEEETTVVLDACIVSRDLPFAQFVRLTLLHRLTSVTVSESAEHLPPAARYVFDLDSCPPLRYPAGEILCTSRRLERPVDFPHLWVDRPFRPARLLALFGLIDPPRPADLTRIEEKHSIRLGTAEIPLSKTEYALFSVLDAAEGAYVPAGELLHRVWGEDVTYRSLVGVYVHYLREKLERDGVKRIFCARGRGYRLEKGAPDDRTDLW